jgi:hypothetical protein
LERSVERLRGLRTRRRAKCGGIWEGSGKGENDGKKGKARKCRDGRRTLRRRLFPLRRRSSVLLLSIRRVLRRLIPIRLRSSILPLLVPLLPLLPVIVDLRLLPLHLDGIGRFEGSGAAATHEKTNEEDDKGDEDGDCGVCGVYQERVREVQRWVGERDRE